MRGGTSSAVSVIISAHKKRNILFVVLNIKPQLFPAIGTVKLDHNNCKS